jgi:2'-5' RNA ligase
VPKARLFVALELPAEVRQAIGSLDLGALRPVPAEALHVTLAFLGHLPESSIPAVEAGAFARLACVAPAELSVGTWKGVPPRRPRLFAVDLVDHGGRCAAIAAAVQGGLIASSLYEPETRPFWPHVTAARVRAHENPPRIDTLPPLPEATFTADSVVLYRSRPARSGARYEALARRSLQA